MANILAQLLQGSSYAYKRQDCATMDSSSTSLPAAATHPLTVNGVLLAVGDRALYTALTSPGQTNNEIYVQHEDSTSGQAMYSMVPATDGRGTAGNPGASTKFDMVLMDDTQLLWVYNGTTWVNMDSL